MTTSVWIYVALWLGLNAAFVALRFYVTRQVKTTSILGQAIFATADRARHSPRSTCQLPIPLPLPSGDQETVHGSWRHAG